MRYLSNYLLTFFFVLLVASCATKTKIEYRDRVVNHYNTVTIHDTLMVGTSDSIHHEIRVVNDTVYDTKYVEKTRWRDHIVSKTDTCYRDSIRTEYKETTKAVLKYPKTYWWFFCISIISIIFAIIKLKRWLKIL